MTFATAREAHAFLAAVRTDVERGERVDVDASKVTLEEYAWRWLCERPLLRPRSRELYEGLLRLHMLPSLGSIVLRDLSPAAIRTWHAELLSGPHTDAIDPRYRVLVLTAPFTGLRLGELRALTRPNLDLLHATVRVEGQLQELKDGTFVIAPPKTAAGVRTVSIPAALIPEFEEHLGRWAAPGVDGFVFAGTKDQPLWRGSLYAAWRRAVSAVGTAGLHFHDLRHTGATLAAATGASTKELIARLGHASPRAALIYQHATGPRDETIAHARNDAIARRAPVRLAPTLAFPDRQ